MTKLEELKQALEAATPGPWGQNPFTPINIQLKSGLTICSMGAATARSGSGFEAELLANARLIVEAVNNLPKLLKVVEAAKDLPYLYDQASADPYDVGYSQVSDEIELLREALEELNNDK